MKVLLDINDKKAAFVMELLHNFSFVKAKQVSQKKAKKKAMEIPDWHIAIIQQRIQSNKINPKSAIDFDKAIDDIEKGL